VTLNQEDREELLNQIKMEIVAELGLMEKVEKVGWSGLSAAESGRVGGLMTQRLRQLR
jgi:hypothetical protein